MPQVDRVQIIEQDIVLAHFLLELYRKILLLYLSADALGKSFVRPARENIVLDQLLRNRRSSLRKAAAFQTKVSRAENSLNIDAMVIVKPLILNCDESVLQVLRYHVHRNRNSIGIGGYELRGLFALIVVDECGKSCRCNVNVADVRRCVNHSPESTESRADRSRDHTDNRNQKKRRNKRSNLVRSATPSGIQLSSDFDNIIAAVIHICVFPCGFL